MNSASVSPPRDLVLARESEIDGNSEEEHTGEQVSAVDYDPSLDGREDQQKLFGVEKQVEKLQLRLSDVRNRCKCSPSVRLKILIFWSRYRVGQKETQILNKLREADPEDKKHIVRLERTFEHRGHLCLVFESMRSVCF